MEGRCEILNFHYTVIINSRLKAIITRNDTVTYHVLSLGPYAVVLTEENNPAYRDKMKANEVADNSADEAF